MSSKVDPEVPPERAGRWKVLREGLRFEAKQERLARNIKDCGVGKRGLEHPDWASLVTSEDVRKLNR
jgi:hypothetical protein